MHEHQSGPDFSDPEQQHKLLAGRHEENEKEGGGATNGDAPQSRLSKPDTPPPSSGSLLVDMASSSFVRCIMFDLSAIQQERATLLAMWVWKWGAHAECIRLT